MSTPFLASIDWSRPWLAGIRTVGEAVANSPDWQLALNNRANAMQLCNHRGLPIRFVPQADLPSDMAYETFISNTGGVPTRDNLHDFFNALVWLAFPQIKVQLNALQAREIEKSVADNNTAPRGKLRDAATIFDENAVLLITSNDDLVQALRSHEWDDLFVKRRTDFIRDCSVFLFGHALMEKLVTPYKAITGHVWIVTAVFPSLHLSIEEQCRWIDAAVAQQLAHGLGNGDLKKDGLKPGLSTADFSPLPVLGVPGWWLDQDEKFYRDTFVFRPKRCRSE